LVIVVSCYSVKSNPVDSTIDILPAVDVCQILLNHLRSKPFPR
jgi:hypothetical protein